MAGVGQFKIITWNIDSARSRVGRKVVDNLVKTEKPEILLLQETRLKDGQSLYLDKMRIFRNDDGVGTAVAVKDEMKVNRIYPPELEGIDTTLIETKIDGKETLIGSIYVKCNTKQEVYKRDLKKLITVGTKYKQVIFGGDWNSDCEKSKNNMTRALNRVLKEYPNLEKVLPSEKTNRGITTIDFYLINSDLSQRVEENTIIDGPKAHQAVKIIISISSFERRKMEWIQDLGRTNWIAFRELVTKKIKTESPVLMGSKEEIDVEVRNFSKTIIESLSETTPKVKVKCGSTTPLPEEAIRVLKQKSAAIKQKYRSNARKEWKEYMSSYIKEKDREFKRIIEEHLNKELEEKINCMNNQRNPFEMFGRLKGKKKAGVESMKLEFKGKTTSTPEKNAESLASYYEELYSMKVPQNANPQSIRKKIKENMSEGMISEVRVTREELEEVKRALNNKKSAGKDGISNKVIKKLPEEAWRKFLSIINKCWEKGYFPKEWKEAVIVPLKKKPNAKEPKELRPISMLSNLGKILEQTILKRLREDEGFTEEQNQFAYRKTMGTTNAVDLLRAEMEEAERRKEDMAICAIDAEKAFDSVWGERLLLDMSACIKEKRIIIMLASFMSERNAAVRVGNITSRKIRIERGVPQGSILGPVLFTQYIKEKNQEFPTASGKIKYADDCLLWTRSRYPGTIKKRLCQLYKETEKEMNEIGINLNAGKTEYIVVKNGYQKEDKKEKFEKLLKDAGVDAKRSKEIKYLGVMIEESGKWNAAAREARNKGKRAWGAASWILKRKELNEKLKCRLYKQTIRPGMMYGSEVWRKVSKFERDKLEVLERRILRTMLRIGRKENGHSVENEKVYAAAEMECSIIEEIERRRTKFKERREENLNEWYVNRVKDLEGKREDQERRNSEYQETTKKWKAQKKEAESSEMT